MIARTASALSGPGEIGTVSGPLASSARSAGSVPGSAERWVAPTRIAVPSSRRTR